MLLSKFNVRDATCSLRSHSGGCSTKIHEIHENRRKSTKINENRRKPRASVGHLEVTWRLSSGHLEVIWKSFGSHLEVIWKSFGSHLELIWKSFGRDLEVMWRSSGNHLELIWTPFAVILISSEAQFQIFCQKKKKS